MDSSRNPAPSLAQLSPLKLALLAEQARARSEPVLRADPIAIVGMGCRLPGGASDPASFWELLRNGVDAVREVPPGRWDVATLFDPDPAAPGRMAAKQGGFLDAIDGFDAAYFGILPREAEQMDPQQRLFLEVAVEALEHAGLTRERLAGSRTGAFVASYYNDYAQLQAADAQGIDSRSLTGTLHSVLVNRLSYLLDLRGPSVSVDTACSSSLVAIHLACQSLRHGECDAAIAGGVSLMVGPTPMITLSKVGFMAPDGRCKTFDARADGFGRGEGCSVIVMKRLADAVRDGDRVLALLRGSAVNQDGHSTVLAAPNGLAQQALIREALANAQIEPRRIGYVEAHGTGTALGDPIEVEALAAVLGAPAADAGPCLLGAAKANLGHLEAAAGVTGVVKSVLVLQHGEVPPQVHFTQLNPHIRLAGTRLAVPGEPTPWPAGAAPRCAGVSGFGVGGTNAHVVLEEAPLLAADDAPAFAAAPWLLPMSARSPAALRALAQRWMAFLGRADAPLPALCASAGERRSHHPQRLAVVGDSAAQMIERLQAFLVGAAPSGWASGRPAESGTARIAFVFGGQGQQWAGMARELLEGEPVFRAAIEEIEQGLRAHVAWSLRDELRAPAETSRLERTDIAQPAIFAVQVALCRLWAHWGFRPDGVVGHSVGEIAALHVAGALPLDEALRIVVQRARFMHAASGAGAMAAVGLTPAQAAQRLAGLGARLSVGAVNSPRGVVLSGEAGALRDMLAVLEREGIAQRALPVNYAFHSAQMRPHADALVDALGRVRSQTGALPVYSTVTGARLAGAAPDAAYFGRNVRETVRFADAIGAMLDDGFTTFVEIAAHPVLAASIAECGAGRGVEPLTLASLRRGKPEREAMLTACAGLYAAGHAPDWPALQGAPAEVLDLPAYPWQHQRFWLKRSTARHSVALPGQRLPVAGVAVFESTWPSAAPAWLADHRLGGQLLLPGMAMLEAMRLAAQRVAASEVAALEDFVIHRPLVLGDGDAAPTRWQVVVGADEVALHLQDGEDATVWHRVADARVARTCIGDAPAEEETPARDDAAVDGAAIYAAFRDLGVEFGPAFRTIERLSPREGGASAWLCLPAEAEAEGDAMGCHPVLLDAALQACVAALGGGRPAQAWLPVRVGCYRLLRAATPRLRAEVRVTRAAGGAAADAQAQLFDADGQRVASLDGIRFELSSTVGAAAAPRADEWLHEVSWVVDDTPPATMPRAAGSWLIVGDEPEPASALLAALRTAGAACRHIGLADAGALPLPSNDLAGVVLLAPMHAPDAPLAVTAPALRFVQALLRSGGAALTVVTSGAQTGGAAVPRPAPAALWALAGVAGVEHPELGLRLIDLDPDAPEFDAAALAAELLRAGAVPRLALRGGQRLVPRLQHRPALPATPARLKLAPGPSHTLDDLAWQPMPPASPGAGEVRVRVVAAGLNFRDVLMALGMIPGQLGFLGAECAGIVQAVGEGVTDLRVGDAVFGLAPGALASEVLVPAAFLARWPAELGTLEQAAALPAAWLTAMLGLQGIAGLRAGQSVLVHAGSGGVGWAAVQIALRAGATVFATAGSPAKRELLRSLGVAQVFDSRTLDFAPQLRAATGGRGVDVVLNSLAGEFIGASVECLAPAGCFLELGKRELWPDQRFHAVRPAARYAVYDLGTMARDDPSLVRPLLDELLVALAAGALRAAPLRVFEFAQAHDAMRLMAQARHVGKLVLRAPAALDVPGPPVRATASYLITGGLGALGLHTARWLAQRGARHLVLTGRGAPTPATQAVLDELARQGVAVRVCRVDAADATAMAPLVDELARAAAPLRGVIHAAGQLDDGVLLQQDEMRLAAVLRGKAEGALLLDALTRDVPLDFFVLYSAAGPLLGASGQSTYASANAVLDAIAHARRAAGLPALAVDWGLWRDGMAAGAAQAAWSARGLGAMDADGGMARLERLLREGATQAAVLPIAWNRFLATLPAGVDRSFFGSLAAGAAPASQRVADPAATLTTRWRTLPAGERRDAMLHDLAQQALQVLGLGADTPLDARRALKDAGLDSLMAVELRNLLARATDTSLPATLLFDHPTLDALADFLMRKLDLLPVAAPPVASDAQRALAALSDAEAEAQLLAELEAGPGAAR